MLNKEDSKQRLLIVASVAIVILLLMNGYLLYNYFQQDTTIERQNLELEESDRLRIEMDKQYHQALSDLEEMRTGNEELNAIIDEQKAELKQQRDRIDQLLKGGGSLDRARAELKNLKAQVQEYTARIEKLKAENEDLRSRNERLAQRTENLSSDLDSARLFNQSLSSEKAQLEQDKLQLTADRTRLSNKVTLASVVKVDGVNTTGMKVRDSGKKVKKRYAKNVDLLQICFTATANEVTNPGVEQFHVRIINPIGETMALDENSAGILIDRATGEEVRYSSIREHDYDNSPAEICFDWAPANPTFTRGNYQVEVYNKDYFAGKGEFQLK